MSDLINVDKLFSQISKYFDTDAWMQESIQNAYRANAKTILFKIDENKNSYKITIKDNGTGIADIKKSISLANSSWDDTDIKEQDPAGLGLVSLLAISNVLEITSKFGHIEIHSDQFFNSKDFRLNFDNYINKDVKSNGTIFKLTLSKNNIHTKKFTKVDIDFIIHSLYKEAANALINVLIVNKISNETKIIKRLDPASFKKEYEPFKIYPIEYENNYGYIDVSRHYYFPEIIIFHGKTINTSFLSDIFPIKFLINAGSPLTPNLPDRNYIINDSKYEAFKEHLQTVLEKYIEKDLEHVYSILNDPNKRLESKYSNIIIKIISNANKLQINIPYLKNFIIYREISYKSEEEYFQGVLQKHIDTVSNFLRKSDNVFFIDDDTEYNPIILETKNDIKIYSCEFALDKDIKDFIQKNTITSIDIDLKDSSNTIVERTSTYVNDPINVSIGDFEIKITTNTEEITEQCDIFLGISSHSVLNYYYSNKYKSADNMIPMDPSYLYEFDMPLFYRKIYNVLDRCH